MSSRALRKLHGRNDLEVLEKSIASKKTEPLNDDEDGGSSDENAVDTSTKQNLFALALAAEELSPEEHDENVESTKPAAKPTRKKKNKKKKIKNQKVEEDLDGMLAAIGAERVTTVAAPSSNLGGFNPLAIQLKNLNPENEMKKKFGQKVVSSNETSRRRGHRTFKKSTHLVTPAQGWQPVTKSGLEMCLIGQVGESQIFQIEHKLEYQKIQHMFWDAVDTMAPENLTAVLRMHPYHIDTLLQLSEVCRMSEDPQMAAELIERALYAYEACFHPLYFMTTGRCVLKYNIWENRGLFLALFRHLINVGNRGCYKTALEYCKLLLSLDPDTDPLCSLLLIDFYALRSDEYNYLIQLYQLWNSTRNLRVLPNFAMSVPLAMFHSSQPDSPERLDADNMLQESLMMFPGILQPLLDECGVNTDEDKNINKHFGSTKQLRQPASLRQLVHLYVGRTSSCWKIPECISWLEMNVQKCCAIGDSEPERFNELNSKGNHLYKGLAPQNVCRHLLMSDIKKAIADLPPEVTNTSVLSYDPLPPPDTVRSYERREARQRQVSNQGFISAFLNSLRPDFDINALVDEDAAAQGAAGGGQGFRDAGANLMNAVRELLNNIELAPAARDDEDEEALPPQDWD